MVAVEILSLHALIVIFFIPFVKSSEESLRTDLYGITWDRAQDACKLHGLENRDKYLRESGIPNEHEFWIGKAIYRVPTRWIEIIGCFQISENHIHSFSTVASVGYCQHKCYSENMGSYFGYKRHIRDTQTHNCVCLTNWMDKRQQRAIQYCVNSKHFFVYRNYNGTVRNSSDTGNCTTICCGNCKMNTANGNNLEGRRCSSENITIVGRCVLGIRQDFGFKWGLNYSGSLNYCMNKNATLAPSNYCQIIDKHSGFEGQISWTNVFREEIEIIKVKDFDQQPKLCFTGILIPVNGNTILNITEQECSRNIKFYICKANSTLDIETRTQYPLYTYNRNQDENVNTSPDPLFSTGNDENSFHSTGAVIGGIMGACSILAVSAVLIICKFRSKGNLKPSDAFQKGQTSNLMFSKKIKPDSTNKRNREINELCETGTSRYSVVNNLTKPENMNDTYTDATDGEYDVLHDKQKRTICPTENMYHSHGVHQHEDGPTYDSAAIVKGIHSYGSELYDTSFSEVEGDYSYMSYKSHDQSTTSDIYDKST
ncbi:uncharacterized protein [Mytilus edulis]|uniref:uncharacterized protein n=1 Tax=Mytilus edulis TaxID=6550 RepID=UPI0039EFD5AD